MSLYIIAGIVLFLCSLHEFSTKKTNKFLYTIVFIGLSLMLCLRFGQGTDYFAYQYIYEGVPITLNLSELSSSTTSIHSEVGWKFLCVISRVMGLDYYTFVALIGAITMFFLHLFITKYCPLKITALFIAYPTLYLTYIFSGLRQALVLCFFLGVLLDLYFKKKYPLFLTLVLLCSLVHTAALVLLVLLIVPLKKFFIRNQDRIILISWIVGILFSIFSIRMSILGRTFSNEGTLTSYIAVAERILTYLVIRFVYNSYKKINGKDNAFLDTIMYMFGICMVFYGLFFSMSTFASRICYFFKCMEIILLTTMLGYSKKTFPEAYYLYIYISLLTIVMLLKNIDSYISQGMYYDQYSSIWTFPYNNIFIKEDFRYSLHQNLLQ